MTTHTHLLLAKIREDANLTQAELARRAGIPRSVMNVYEHGKREPSAEMLRRLLNAGGYRLVAERVPPPVDPVRAGEILSQVIGLAEALPYRPKPDNRYPPLAQTIAARR
jgi:transcriptional regulator with XRE-family HTH domain